MVLLYYVYGTVWHHKYEVTIMNVKLELLKGHIHDCIDKQLEEFEIDENDVADTKAIEILSLIQGIIKNEEYNDFEAIEEIVSVFERYGLDFGYRHDF